jgi:hypothetical protein
LNHILDSLILIDLTLTKIGIFFVIVDKGGEKSHKDKKLSHKGIVRGEEDIVRGRESKRYDIEKGEKAKDMTLERDQLKLSTRVGGASS